MSLAYLDRAQDKVEVSNITRLTTLMLEYSFAVTTKSYKRKFSIRNGIVYKKKWMRLETQI